MSKSHPTLLWPQGAVEGVRGAIDHSLSLTHTEGGGFGGSDNSDGSKVMVVVVVVEWWWPW